jgi:hypothetical protein
MSAAEIERSELHRFSEQQWQLYGTVDALQMLEAIISGLSKF